MEITLKDVEIAIKILYEFFKKQREAQILLSRLGSSYRTSNVSGFSMEDIIKMVMSQYSANKVSVQQETTTEEDTNITEEELARIRQIVNKLESKT